MPLKAKSHIKRIAISAGPNGFYWRELIDPQGGPVGPFPSPEAAKLDAHAKHAGKRLQFVEW